MKDKEANNGNVKKGGVNPVCNSLRPSEPPKGQGPQRQSEMTFAQLYASRGRCDSRSLSEPINYDTYELSILADVIEELESKDKTPEDVRWVGFADIDGKYFGEKCNREGGWFSWDEFAGMAKITFSIDSDSDLVIVGDDWWLERYHQDGYGNEWWEFKTCPKRPVRKIVARVKYKRRPRNKDY